MEEEWRDVPGYEGWLQASNLGQVRSVDRFYEADYGTYKTRKRVKGRMLLQRLSAYGYQEVTQAKQNKYLRFRVHRLVAKAFVPGEFEDAHVDHVDGNKLNNRADNLEWVTKSENTKRAWKLGLARGMQSRLTSLQDHAIRVLYEHNFPPSIIAEWFDISTSYAYQIGKGDIRGEKLDSRLKPRLT